jgi:hypothetical protein
MVFIILLLCWNLFVLQNKNLMLKNELDTTSADCALLIEKNASLSQDLETVNKELESVLNELETVKNELIEIKKENLKWSSKYNKYPVATIAWIYMTEELGWSDVVAAGILGNMMAECGGHTLKLNWDSNGSSGYGLIQWTGGRRNSIKTKYGETPTVVEQLDFVKDELYGTNGVRKQVTNKQLKAIMEAQTPEDCAFAFASYYERCHVNYRELRRGLARKAYNYFTT